MAAPLPRSGRRFRFQRAVRAAERLEVADRPPKCTVSLRWVQAVTLQDVEPPLAFFRRADIADDPIDLDRQAAGAVVERNHGDDTSGGFHRADPASVITSGASRTQASGTTLATRRASPIGLMLNMGDLPSLADQ